jgi:hypothetical protein
MLMSTCLICLVCDLDAAANNVYAHTELATPVLAHVHSAAARNGMYLIHSGLR